MNTKIKVLYVDDEQHNLNSFKALFRVDYTIFLANSTGEASRILEENPAIEIVISDQRMPHQTGVEFFSEIKEKFPLPVRMLLTAYTDSDDMIKAINRGNIFRYITKPWKELEIKAAIEEAYQYYQSNSLLKIKNEELQEAYNELDGFSYTVAHDIRGPILSVLKSLEMLKGMDDAAENRRFLSILEKTMAHLNSYILNTHSYHRLQRGSVSVDDIEFEELIAGIRDVTEMERRLHNITFNVEVDQQEPFRSDRILLSLVIDNIVSNAFKYRKADTKSHEVTMSITVMDGKATITVKDNGIGIEPSELDKVFDLFYRGESLAPGSGFGLYNVQRAISKLGGKVELSSTKGEGTTFKVEIDGK